MREVKEKVSEDTVKHHSWGYKYAEEKNVEFHISCCEEVPNGFTWSGIGCCVWDAKAHGWIAFMEQLNMKDDLVKLRNRWKRWLGQKTRSDKPYWTTLLNSNWTGWATKVIEKNGFGIIDLNIDSTKFDVEHYFRLAICNADIKDLFRLDELYCQEKIRNS
jgi:hypothetical protein